MKTQLHTSVIGSYPPAIDTMDLMRSYFLQEDPSWEQPIQKAVQDMLSAGIMMVSDGQTRDPFIQLFTRRMNGCRIRQRTEVIGPIEDAGPIISNDLHYVRRLLPRHTKLIGILTGPYTLTKSCVDLYYHDESTLSIDFAHVLRKEAERVKKYVDLISIDEPFFSNHYPENAAELISILTKGLSCPTRLHVCGDVSAIVQHLVDLPVDMLSHEFKASPFLLDVFKQYPARKKICLGSVRSDDSTVESVQDIVAHVHKGYDVFGDSLLQIAPDCGQRLLPRSVAFQKLQNLAKAQEVCYGR